jgi:hypothetical protein
VVLGGTTEAGTGPGGGQEAHWCEPRLTIELVGWSHKIGDMLGLLLQIQWDWCLMGSELGWDMTQEPGPELELWGAPGLALGWAMVVFACVAVGLSGQLRAQHLDQLW